LYGEERSSLKGNDDHAREFHSFAKANVNANITFEELAKAIHG
jgi:hypothetical protein